VLTEQQRNNLMSKHKLDPKKIIIIPIGIKNEKILTKKEYKSLHNNNIIGFFGFIRKGKGLEILLDAFYLLSAQMKNISLIYTLSWAATAAVLAGCGHKSDAKSELENAANALAKTEPAQAASLQSRLAEDYYRKPQMPGPP